MNKVPFDSVKEILNERIGETNALEFYGVEIDVKYLIPFNAFCEAVGQIVDCCYDSESGEYMPELRELATRMVVAAYYTNLELPGDIDELSYLLFTSNLMDDVYSLINRVQLRELHKAVEKRCDLRNDTNRVLFERELKEVTDGVQTMAAGIREMFNGVAPEDMQKLVDILMNEKIDEEKLVDAVVRKQSEIREKVGNDGE